MARFDYLEPRPQKKGKDAKKPKKVTPEPDGRGRGETIERVEPVYVRKETVRAVWREVKKSGGESVSELVEELLLRWLRDRTR